MRHQYHQKIMPRIVGFGLTLLLLSACSTPVSSTSIAPNQVQPSVEVASANYFSESGKFEVWLPATQSIHEAVVSQAVLGMSVACQVLWSRDYGAVWLIQYCDFPQEVTTKFTVDELLDATRDHVLQNEHAVLIDEKDISSNNLYPGRSITADAAMRGTGGFDGTYEARIYLVNNRIYCIAAKVYEENWGDRMSMMDPFLESLYIDGG